jgi:Tfp pilus assembly protein PilF
MAIAYMGKNDFETALKQLSKALKKDKKYPDIYIVQGQVNAALGNYDVAIDDLNFLLSLEPVFILYFHTY